jgi:hypothetical protein
MGEFVMDIQRVQYYLSLWTDYMKHGNSNKLGYSNKSVGFSTGGVNSFEDLTDDMDVQQVLIVDSVIDDLPKEMRESVYATHLGNKTNMTMMSIAYNYQLAVAELATRLEKKHLI